MPQTPCKDWNVVPLIVKRRPGRPRKVRPAPDASELDYVAEVAKAAESFINDDPVVTAFSCKDAGDIGSLNLVMHSLAEEQAALLFDRLRLTREGRGDPAPISSRRVDALLKLGRLVVQRENTLQESGDLDPAHLDQVVGMLVAEVAAVIEDTTAPEIAERFMAVLHEKMKTASFPSCCLTSTPAAPGGTVGGCS